MVLLLPSLPRAPTFPYFWHDTICFLRPRCWMICDTSNNFCLPPQDTYANFRKSTVDGSDIRLTTTWDVKKKPVNNGINYQPQILSTGFLARFLNHPSRISVGKTQIARTLHPSCLARSRELSQLGDCTTRIIFPIATSCYLVIFLNAIILIFIWYQY